MSNFLWPHGLQQVRLPRLSLSPEVCSNSYSLSQSCDPTISSSVAPYSYCPQSFQHQGLFHELALCIGWSKYWSFSFRISPSNEYSGLTFLGLTVWSSCPKNSQESSPAPQFESINSLALSLLYGPVLTSIHDYWENYLLVLFSSLVMSNSLETHEGQHARLPCPSVSPGVCPNLCSLSWWCHPTISSSVALLSSCPQSFPASSNQMAKALEFQLQHQSFHWIFRVDFF